MHQNLSFESPSVLNSSLPNFSDISCDKTGIIQTKDLTDSYQVSKDQSILVLRDISYFNTSKIQPSNNKINENHPISLLNPCDETFYNHSSNLDFDEINKSDLLLNLLKQHSKPIKNSRIVHQKEEESFYDKIFQLNETIEVIDNFGIDKKKQPLFNQSSIQIQFFNENSRTQPFIQKSILDKIKIGSSIDQAQISDSNNKEFTISNYSSNLTTPKKDLSNPLEASRTQFSTSQRSSENIIYDDRGPEDFLPLLKLDDKVIEKQKIDAYNRRKLIKENQLSILPKLKRAQRSDFEKEFRKKQEKKPRHLVGNLPENQQNLKIMNEMFCYNENTIKKRYNALSKRFYNTFYIDETTPFHNRYILDLSINIGTKNVAQLKQGQKMELKQLQHQQKENQQKMNQNQKHQNKSQDPQGFQDLQGIEQKQRAQNNVTTEENEERRKYVQERNRKKKQKKIELKKNKQEKQKIIYGTIKKDFLKFNVSMDLLTKVSWEDVVYLKMHRSSIVDKDFKYFVDKAKMFPNLMRMDFSENQITDDGFTYFILFSHKFENLFDIFFDHNKITNQGIKELSQSIIDFRFYKRIHLSENLIDDKGFTYFFLKGENYPNLIKIRLGGNQSIHKPMTCHGLEVFAKNLSQFKGLREIYLASNLISDYGLIQFSKEMHKLESLANLNLGMNKITSIGFNQFLRKIYSLPNIRKIHFNRNYIQKIPKKQIKYLIKHPKEKLLLLNLKFNPFEKDEEQQIFLMDIFLNMKFKFKLEMNLYFPQNLDLQKVGCDIQKFISIINGTFTNVVEMKHSEQAQNQIEPEQNEEQKTNEKQQKVKFGRLRFLNLSHKNFTSNHWIQLVKNFNNFIFLQELNLDNTKINTIKFDELCQIQQHVIKRQKKYSQLLKISMLGIELDKQALEALDHFINYTSDRRVFVITSMKNELQQRQTLQNNAMFHEQRTFQQKRFKVIIESYLESGIMDTLTPKECKKSQAEFHFIRMLKTITKLCGNQLANYEKVKNMFYELHHKIITCRIYPTKKNQIDKTWKIVESYFLSQIQKWCENIKIKENSLEFDEKQIKTVLEEVIKVKEEKLKKKPKQKKTEK